MRLLDKRKNQVFDVADNLVNDAIASGNYEMFPGIIIPVTLPDGSAGELDSSELPQALQLGVKYRTAEEDKRVAEQEIAAIRKEAIDKPLTAFTLGALRGGTLGISDVAIRAIGGKDTADLVRKVAEESPAASLTGEIAGGIASFVTPAGAAGAISRVAGAPTRLATELGAKAAAGIGRGAESLSATQKIGRALVAGGVEGAAVGAGQTLSELALADPELTAQKALTNIGMGGLLGAGISGTGRGLFEGVRSGTTAALQAMAKSEFVPKTAKELAGRLSEIYGDAAIAIRGLEADPVFEKTFARGSTEFRRDVLENMADENKMLTKVASQFEDVKKFGDDLSAVAREGTDIQAMMLDAQTGKAPRKKLLELDEEDAELTGIDAILEDRIIKGPNLVQAEKAAGFEIFDRIQQAGKNLVNDTDEMLARMREANTKAREVMQAPVYDDATIRDVASRAEALSTAVYGATKPSDISRAITTFKNELAPIYKIPKGKTLEAIKVENRPLWESIGEVRSLWVKAKELTVNPEVFGELGAAMGKRAEALSNVIRATDDLLGNFYRIRPGKTMNSREFVPDLAKIKSYIVNPDAARNMVKTENIAAIKTGLNAAIEALTPVDVTKFQDEIKRLQKLLAKTERIPANKAGAATKQKKMDFLNSQIDGLQDEVNKGLQFNANIGNFKKNAAKRIASFEQAFEVSREIRMAAILLNRMQSVTGRSLLGTVLGGNIAGLPGALAGTMLYNPKSMLKFISAMEDAATGLDKMTVNASARFKNIERRVMQQKGLTKVLPAARQAIIRDRLRIEPGERYNDDEAAFKAHRKKLNELKSNPQALLNRIYDAAGDEAMSNPRTTLELYNTAQRGFDFLESKIPKDPYSPGLYSDDDFAPSPVELSQYADYAEAVMRPKVLIKQMAAGDINYRTVEAVKAVYPKMYNNLLTQVTASLMGPKQVAYDTRVQLGILFDIPTVKAMQPDYLARIMRYYSSEQPEQAQQQTAVPTTRSQLAGLREMKVAEREVRA